MPRLRSLLVATTAGPLIALLIAAAPVQARTTGTIPPDVGQAYAGAAAWVHAAFDGDPVLERATGVRNIVEVFSFTPAYLQGGDGVAILTMDEWVATIVDAAGNSIGTLRVWRPDGSAEIAGGSADVRIDLAEVGAGVYIEEPMTGSAYVLRGETLFPINDAALSLMPQPTTVTAFQSVMARWVADARDANDDLGSDVGLWFFGGALVLSTAVGLMVLIQRRRIDSPKRDQ